MGIIDRELRKVVIEAVKEFAVGLEIPENSRLILGGSLLTDAFRDDSDIDIWLISTIPDRVVGNTIHATDVDGYSVRKQLPTKILGHEIHFLVPSEHPIPIMMPDEHIILKERSK